MLSLGSQVSEGLENYSESKAQDSFYILGSSTKSFPFRKLIPCFVLERDLSSFLPWLFICYFEWIYLPRCYVSDLPLNKNRLPCIIFQATCVP